ncbi:MAG: AmpG family muropeptide MFS transporter [Holosporales bacterium]
MSSVTLPVSGLRLYASRRMAAQLLLGFSSGLPYLLVFSTLSLRLREAGLSLAAIGLFSLVKAPYTFKVFWAPLLDRWAPPLLTPWLGRRRAWAVVFQLGLIACLCGMAMTDPKTALDTLALWAIGVAFFSASQDVVLDAYRSEMLPEGELAGGAAVFVTGYRVALLVAGAGATGLAATVAWESVYLIMAGVQGIGIISLLLFTSRPAVEGQAVRDPLFFLAPLKAFFIQKGVLWILLLALSYKLSDGFLGTLSGPLYLDLGFDKPTIAWVSKLFGFAATIMGGLVGGWLAPKLGLRLGLIVGAVLQTASNGFYYVLLMFPTKAILAGSVFIENFCSGIGTAMYLAAFGLFSRGSHTATHFALLTSLMALTRDSLSALSGYVADGFGWSGFIIVGIVVGLPSLWVAAKAGKLLEARHGGI